MASITTWNRLEPRPRNVSLEKPLAAPVRDPLWFLSRQWQLGEFRGEDACSPAYVQVTTRESAITGWRTGKGPVQALATDTPLETTVEREPSSPDVSVQVELGQMFEALVGAASPAAFLAQFPVVASTLADTEMDRFVSVCARRAVNGVALLDAIQSNPASVPAVPGHTTPPQRQALFDAFIAQVEEVFGTLGSADPPTWVPERFEYDVQVVADLPGGGTGVLTAQPAQAGGFEWHAFDLASRSDAQAVQPPATTRSVLPTNVRFRGMPNAKWWDFENNITDFGGIQPERRDLAKLAVMDFMLLHGNDWYIIPFDLPVNSLSRVELLLVHDVFGGTTVVPRAEDTGPDRGRWTMFSTAIVGTDQVADFMLLPSTAADAIYAGTLLEDVRIVRDPLANMVWAIEQQTEGGIGQPRFGRERDNADGLPPLPVPPPPLPGAPQLRYQIETTVPKNWFPFLPISINPVRGEIALQLGAMLTTSGPPVPNRAEGRLLNSTNIQPPTEPYTLREEEATRVGVRVIRVLARSRWLDGSTHQWIARRKYGGPGEGSSGLKFDLAVPTR
jgi:hypothetical protein